MGGEAISVITDVSSEASVKNLVQTTVEKFGRIDILNEQCCYFCSHISDA